MKDEIKQLVLNELNSQVTGNGYKPVAMLTPRQLANNLQVSEKTLERMRKDGSGPPFKIISKRPRYLLEGVIKWLQQTL